MKIRTVILCSFFLSSWIFPLAHAENVSDGEILPTKTTLTPLEQRLVSWIDEHETDILEELKQYVELNTGTENIDGIDQYRNLLSEQLRQLGFTTQTHSTPPQTILSCSGGKMYFADHLTATRSGNKSNRILLNGHMDTVFGAADEFQKLLVDADGVMKGPGVADMKGGMVIMFWALKSLAANNGLEGANITVLLNSDEEIGSLGSRSLIEDLARKHDIGLVFEGSHNNKMTRSRKGLGQVRIKVTGRESHAGASHSQGVSAILELAHKIVAIEKLTNYDNKVTVNVGVVKGGEKRNTISGCADGYIDLRYPTLSAGEKLIQDIDAIVAKNSTHNDAFPGLPIVQNWSRLHRPAKDVNAEVDKLLAEAMGISLLVGEPVEGTVYSGGGTDGSIMQSVGLPVLDSLGVDGAGAHSSREETTVQSLIARTKLAVVMLHRQINKKR